MGQATAVRTRRMFQRLHFHLHIAAARFPLQERALGGPNYVYARESKDLRHEHFSRCQKNAAKKLPAFTFTSSGARSGGPMALSSGECS